MPEQRKEQRLRTFKGAKISFRGLNIAIDCIVRDLSPHGARLEVVSQNGVPNSFELVMDSDKSVRHCRVAWRKANRLGVEFQ